MFALAVLLVALHPAPAALHPGGAGSPTGVPAPPSERVHPAVTPRTGGTRTQFRLALTARVRLSTGPDLRSYYALAINGPAECSGRDDASSTVTSARAGQRVTVRLHPGIPEWCTGEHTVTVTLIRQIICRPGEACPALAYAPLMVGRAHFRVVLGGVKSKRPPGTKHRRHTGQVPRSKHGARSNDSPRPNAPRSRNAPRTGARSSSRGEGAERRLPARRLTELRAS